MAHRISIYALYKVLDYGSEEALIQDYEEESIVTDICSEGCFVEQDGRCPHDNPSMFIALGVI